MLELYHNDRKRRNENTHWYQLTPKYLSLERFTLNYLKFHLGNFIVNIAPSLSLLTLSKPLKWLSIILLLILNPIPVPIDSCFVVK